MKNQVAIRWARNPWLAALLLVAFCSRALIPTGFMPGQGGLVLCSGYAPIAHSMVHDMSGMDMGSMDMAGMDMSQHSGTPARGGHTPDHESMGICPFAAAATTMAALNAPTVAILSHFVSTNIDLPVQPFVPRGTIVPTRLPRGPPSLV